jgi:cell volume regulation protein A
VVGETGRYAIAFTGHVGTTSGATDREPLRDVLACRVHQRGNRGPGDEPPTRMSELPETTSEVTLSFDAHQMDSVLLLGAVVMLAAILAVRVSVGMGLPSLLLYLLMGVLLGEAGLGIEFEDANVAHALGFAALVLILAEGGLTTQWAEIRPVMKHGVALATVGVGVSVTVMAVGAHYLFGLDWQLAVLLGAVTSPTDAAAVFSVLRRVPLPRQLTGVLEAESGLNDAPTVLLVTLVSTGAALTTG